MNKKITKLIFIAILFCGFGFNGFAQMQITFTASNPPILTQADVNAQLTNNQAAITASGGFIANFASNITIIGDKAFFAPRDHWPGNPINHYLVRADGPNVRTIAGGAFSNCSGLISVNFPLVTEIGGSAFGMCQSLISVDFPLVTTIGGSTFSWCTSLMSVNFPLVTTIRERAFQVCTSLESINFPLVTTIEVWAFALCNSLTSASFPLVTTIGEWAFNRCSTLTLVDFPLVTTIKPRSFRDCISLSSVSFGTGFTIPTTISFEPDYWTGSAVFEFVQTYNADLTLGGYVLPSPNLTNRTWQNNRGDGGTGADYRWKSITGGYIPTYTLILMPTTNGTVITDSTNTNNIHSIKSTNALVSRGECEIK